MKYYYHNSNPTNRFSLKDLKNQGIYLEAISRLGITLCNEVKEWSSLKLITFDKLYGKSTYHELIDQLLVGTLGPIQVQYWIRGGKELYENFGGMRVSVNSKPLVTHRVLIFNGKNVHILHPGHVFAIGDYISNDTLSALKDYKEIQKRYSFLMAHPSKHIKTIATMIVSICEGKLNND